MISVLRRCHELNDSIMGQTILCERGKSNIADYDREELTAFLSSSEGHAPVSGQINGVEVAKGIGISNALGRDAAPPKTQHQ